MVLRIFRGEPLDLLSRELGVELYRLEKWRDAALAGMEEALKARNGDPLKAELDNAMKRPRRVDHGKRVVVGPSEAPRPFSPQEVEEMSGTVSCATDRPYGVKLVCHTWEQPRSSYYADRQVSGLPVKLTQPGKRGPKTALSDAELLELIRADLQASPFQGEGHRKVWARLRVRDGVKVGRRRVLRLMRENQDRGVRAAGLRGVRA